MSRPTKQVSRFADNFMNRLPKFAASKPVRVDGPAYPAKTPQARPPHPYNTRSRADTED